MIAPIAEAAEAGNASIFVNGIDPGFANDLLPMALAGTCQPIEQIRCMEIINYDTYDSATVMFDVMGFGKPLDEIPMLLQPGVLSLAWGSVVRQLSDCPGHTCDGALGSINKTGDACNQFNLSDIKNQIEAFKADNAQSVSSRDQTAGKADGTAVSEGSGMDPTMMAMLAQMAQQLMMPQPQQEPEAADTGPTGCTSESIVGCMKTASTGNSWNSAAGDGSMKTASDATPGFNVPDTAGAAQNHKFRRGP